MQLTAKALLAAVLLMSIIHTRAETKGQAIHLHLEKATLQQAFNEIGRQSGKMFLYTDDMLKDATSVSVSLSNVTLSQALDECLKKQPLTWKEINRTIVISRKAALKLSSLDTTKTIKGRVSAQGLPLAGASVMIKDRQQGATTKEDGTFEIQNVKTPATLLISSIGHMTATVTTDGSKPVNIELEINPNNLDQAVIIGYGTTTKRLNTGSVGKVTKAEIERQPVSNPLQAIQGRVPGLMITQNTGLPGGDFTIQLRGRNSLRSEGNALLYIVDGVPFPSTSLHNNLETANGAIHPLNSISPQDIESIEVLKDADATAIYGSRGANGVILITTKKGKAGPPALTFNAWHGVGKVASKMKLLNIQQYLSMRREAFENDGMQPDSAVDYDLTAWDATRNNDWQKELIGGTARTTNAGISYGGGSAGTQFLIGSNYYRETTVLPGDFGDEKKSVLLNLTHKEGSFEINVSANYLKQKANLFKTDVTNNALMLAPNVPAMVDNVNHKVLFPAGVFDNPYQSLFRPTKIESDNLVSNAKLRYSITKDIDLSASLGYTKMNLDENSKVPLRSMDRDRSPNSRGLAFTGRSSMQTWIAEPQANWTRRFGEHQLRVMVGTTFQETISKSQTVYASGYNNDDLLDNIVAASKTSILANGYTQYRYSSAFSRISYNAYERYLLNLSGRMDASSRFGPGKRVGNFGAIGAGWIFSKETWISKTIPALSFGKLRTSYGITGNDQIGDYGYIDKWAPDPNIYLGTSGLYPQNLQNKNYSWEANKKFEAAIETGWLNDRITAGISWYRNRCSNQLIFYALPGTTGFEGIQDNFPATVENTGWESEISATLINNKDWNWTFGGNISFPRNKLLKYPGIETSTYKYSYRVGRPMTDRQSFHFTGMNPETGAWTYEDVNKDGMISWPDDIQFSKGAQQRYFGGIDNQLRYKQFTLDIFLQYVRQTGFNYIAGFITPGFMLNQPDYIFDRWQQPGDDKPVQRFTQDYNSDAFNQWANGSSLGDNMIGDASFIRLKNVNISYTMANSSLGNSGIKNITIFLRGQNLLTLTNYRGLDPENQSFSRLPPLKVFIAGVQVQL